MSADLTISHAHRTALRRIDRGEPVGDLGETLGALYLHELVVDAEGKPEVTDAGRTLLEAHDRLADTRRVERPRLEPRPVPKGWRTDVVRGFVHELLGLVRPWGETVEADERRAAEARAMLELGEWIAHSRAVEAQEAATEAPYCQPPMTESSGTPQEVLAAHVREVIGGQR